MRGKQLVARGGLDRVRITPADAGKTWGSEKVYPFPPDHPRGCGENSHAKLLSRATVGSPPRMRGKPYGIRTDAHKKGITPADAGKTL